MPNVSSIPVRHFFARSKADLPAELQAGTLYFVADEATIYNKDLSFSGINRVTASLDGDVVTLNFNDDYGTDGNKLSISLASSTILRIIQRHAEEIEKIKGANHIVFNGAVLNPEENAWTLRKMLQAIHDLETIQHVDFEKLGAGLIFTDNKGTHYYIFDSGDADNFYTPSYWKRIQAGSNQEVVHCATKEELPPIGEVSTIYICDDHKEIYRWDTTALSYKICGFDPNNIKYINANF